MEKLISEFSIGLFFWQTIIFILLIFLLKKYAWKPILDAVNEREEGIKNALLSAEKAKEEMASLQSDNEETLKKARALEDHPSVFVRPVPSMLQKSFAGQCRFFDALFFKSGHHFGLCCNRGVVGSGNPTSIIALHSGAADDDVL